jgi:hypothetical protein
MSATELIKVHFRFGHLDFENCFGFHASSVEFKTFCYWLTSFVGGLNGVRKTRDCIRG